MPPKKFEISKSDVPSTAKTTQKDFTRLQYENKQRRSLQNRLQAADAIGEARVNEFIEKEQKRLEAVKKEWRAILKRAQDAGYDIGSARTRTVLNERFERPGGEAKQKDSLQLLDNDELGRIADRLHLALSNNTPEATLKILGSFKRDTSSLWFLNQRYTNKFQIDLRSDIEQRLQGGPEAKDKAFYLLGDPASEKKTMDPAQATSLPNALSEQTFDSDYRGHVPVPYDSWTLFPDIQCTLTHIMCEFLKQRGYELRKIIALSQYTDKNGQKQPNLHVKTDLAPDMPKGKDPIVTLTYSMALLIQVKASSSTVELVVDPRLSSKPLTIEQWIGKMGQDSFERISLNTYKDKFIEEYQKNTENPYPSDQTYVFTVPRNTPFLPSSPESIKVLQKKKPIPDEDTACYYNEAGKEMMSDAAIWVPYQRTARFIREELRNPAIDDDASAERFLNTLATDVVKNVNTFHAESTTALADNYPNLSQETYAHLKKRNVSDPIIERLKRLLSGNYASSKVDQSAFFGHFIDKENNNIFLQSPDLKSANAESQSHKMMDLWLLETIPIRGGNTMGNQWIKDGFDCYQDINIIRKCFPAEVVNRFVDSLDRIRQGMTNKVLQGKPADQVKWFTDLNAGGDKRIVTSMVWEFKQRIIQDILAIIPGLIMKDVKSSELQYCISDVMRYRILNYDVLPQKVNNLIDSIDQEIRRGEETDRKRRIDRLLRNLPPRQSLPKLRNLPKEKQWILYIDKEKHEIARQEEEPGMLYDKDQSPGYQDGMIKAFDFIAARKQKNLRKDLDYDEYTKLHQLVTQFVPTPKRMWMRESNGMSKDKGQITFCSLPAIPKDAPGRRERQAALKELHNQRINDLPLFIEHPNFDAPRQKWLVRMDGYNTDEIFKELIGGDDDHALLKSRDEIMNALHITDDPQGIIMGITSTSDGTVSFLPLYSPDEGRKHVQAILKSYSDGKKVPNQTPLDRLRAICETGRALAFLHQKRDATRRTNVYIFINGCLIDEGFCPAIFPDSGAFGGAKTVDGLVEDTLIGMHDYIEAVDQHKLTSRGAVSRLV